MTAIEKELIDEKFRGVYARLDANNEIITATLSRIEKQVNKTNGRVTSLETFKWKLIGGAMVVSTVISFLVAFLKVHLKQDVGEKQKIEITTRGEVIDTN